jgi:hypothetical protein
MGQFVVKGKDQTPIAPASPVFVPSPKPGIPGRAADTNDGGALLWDHVFLAFENALLPKVSW